MQILSDFNPSEICKDASPTSSCEGWKRGGFCKRSYAHKYCKKTCGGCSVGPTLPPTQTPGSCGRSPVAQSRIVNGVNAKPGAWPWIASLQKNNGHYCGATLLSPRWVSRFI